MRIANNDLTEGPVSGNQTMSAALQGLDQGPLLGSDPGASAPQGIPAVIPAGDDQAGHRSRRDAEGGRPLSFDADDYKGGKIVERSINVLKHRRGLVTRCTLLVLTYRGGAVLRAITV